MKKLLDIVSACAFYGRVQALKNVSLHANHNEIVTLIGANGAGKSTLMMSIFGHPRLRSGHIYLDGEEITALPTHAIALHGITLVPEGRRVFPQMSVYENLQSGSFRRHDDKFHENLVRVFATFPVLKERAKQRAGTLSGGEQQMLAIGRGLISCPKLLLLDEPSLGLAPLIIKQIFHVLQSIADDGTTIFLVEQNANMALNFAHRGYVLVNGKITMSGNCKDILADKDIKSAYLGK